MGGIFGISGAANSEPILTMAQVVTVGKGSVTTPVTDVSIVKDSTLPVAESTKLALKPSGIPGGSGTVRDTSV